METNKKLAQATPTAAEPSKPQNKAPAKALWDVGGPVREVVVYCPGCKALETVCYNNDGLLTTSRFTQRTGGIFHKCGSSLPCRLYSLS